MTQTIPITHANSDILLELELDAKYADTEWVSEDGRHTKLRDASYIIEGIISGKIIECTMNNKTRNFNLKLSDKFINKNQDMLIETAQEYLNA